MTTNDTQIAPTVSYLELGFGAYLEYDRVFGSVGFPGPDVHVYGEEGEYWEEEEWTDFEWLVWNAVGDGPHTDEELVMWGDILDLEPDIEYCATHARRYEVALVALADVPPPPYPGH